MKHNIVIGMLLLNAFIMLPSCVKGDLYDLYDENDHIENIISRNKKTKDISIPHITNASNYPFFEISTNVGGSSGCVPSALSEVLPFSKRYIRQIIRSIDENPDAFSVENINSVITALNNSQSDYTISCSTVTTNSIVVGDIAVTNAPLQLTYNSGDNHTIKSDEGHCFVVDEIITFDNTKYFFDDDVFLYCKMDKSYFQGGLRISFSEN